ncbi:MAG: ATP-binding protein [Oscillospiraceae bacterium]|nr:ATP-binding protein [Oscillospiraceae bacterium]
MLREQIYAQATAALQERRRHAQQEQERRSDQIEREIPETLELNRHLRATCTAILQAAQSGNPQERLRQIEQRSLEADAMLRQLLTAHGYPADYLDLHYACPDCSDTGFVSGVPCACLKKEIGRISAEQLNVQSGLKLSSFERFSLSYYRDLPAEQQQAMAKVLQACKRYAADFAPGKAGNLLMFGGTGLGKTHLSLSIAKEILDKGYSVVYDATGSLLHILEREKFGRAEQDDTMQLLLECDLLILDDFGTEQDSSLNRSMIYTLLNSRINSGRAMIVNTNLDHAEIRTRYGDRILSRLLFTSEILHFYGKDIRMQKYMEQRG